ncbi:methyltransferase domain-containing protein [Prosthecochloris sp. SCSIO W1101]|uniref:class I SAM-dependent methyltransferase n=1 Tax=Prosthecochloris sp. SCSIO W1101 TaxID=2992242 RepID=UPI00223D9CB5|nr:methyltransferase domain-containing protein [Prosthecochloris sp. SCSIO W1101]UZJ40541.1 methyltransferase domain-containing protein [Prosthecochloris sp. SCSIO W1101]
MSTGTHSKELSQAAKPSGLKGMALAYLMRWVHRTEYNAVAEALQLGRNDRFLEIGCGSGFFLWKYAAGTAESAGLDHSADMVAMAGRRNARRVNSGATEFRQGDASSLPWQDGSFTAVAAIATFMFWPDPSNALKEVRRVLQQDGRLVISLGWNADDGVDHTGHAHKYGIKLYSGAELQTMLENTGFSHVSITCKKAFMSPGLMICKAVK